MSNLFSKYKVMLNLKRLNSKELEELHLMLHEECKQRQYLNDNKKSMLEHGNFKFKNILKVMFPKKRKKVKKCH